MFNRPVRPSVSSFRVFVENRELCGGGVDVTAGFLDVDAELKVSAGRLLIHLVQLVVVRHDLESACGLQEVATQHRDDI